ncbi:hypothetical protein [Bacillus sp. Hm123]|uniref:hypothetical protein n=1 Tax=Bacillus sp. Hm123 TaxID=3450745 RepID=UPI003F421B14
MKKRLTWIIASALLVLALLLALGFLFQKEEHAKTNGLAEHYDVSSNGTIAYITFTDGKPSLRIKNDKQKLEKELIQYDNDKMILDPSFSADGSQLVYIVSNKDMAQTPYSWVVSINIQTEEISTLFKEQQLITEIELAKNDQSIFYLQAGTFKNYSPITGKRPHDIDIFEYHLKEKKQTQHTKLKEYGMNSLQVDEQGRYAYVAMVDDKGEQTADDVFEMKERIFQISLNGTNKAKVYSDPDYKEDIYDFSFIGNEIIFQAVANSETNGIFEYELFQFDPASNQETQLTQLGKATSRPVIAADLQTVYFMVDKQFGEDEPEYHLYQLDLASKKTSEISLPPNY